MNLLIFKNMRIFWWPAVIFLTLETTFVITGTTTFGSFLLAISLCLVASFGCLQNDLLDEKCDAINKNNGNGHKIPPKQRKQYKAILSVLFLLSLTSSIFIGIEALTYIFVTLVLLIFYNYLQYKTPLSVLLSSITAITPVLFPIIFFSAMEFSFQLHLIILFAIFLLTVSHELVVDINDYEGDQVGGKRTFPITWGKKKTVSLIKSLTVIALILILIQSILWQFNILQFVVVVVFSISMLTITFHKDLVKESQIKRYIKILGGLFYLLLFYFYDIEMC
jgi:4-hydroxybenzoate polyprenyltransferase